MMSSLSIPSKVAETVDDYHLTKLYCVCRFCFARVKLGRRQTKRPPPSELQCQRALRFYGIDFQQELGKLQLPKVLCSTCASRLGDFERGTVDYEKWCETKSHHYDGSAKIRDSVSVQVSVMCSTIKRCRVCCIAGQFVPNAIQRLQLNLPKPGRPRKYFPHALSLCGEAENNKRRCKKALKRSSAAEKEPCVETLEEALGKDGGSQPSFSPIGEVLNSPEQ